MPLLREWAERQRDKIAVQLFDDDESISYGELDSRADAVARWLISLGLMPGDTVGLLLENHLRTFELWWRIRRAGPVGKPISGEMHILNDDCKEVPLGEVGMVFFGGGVAIQYYNDSEKTKSIFNDGGLGTYGDLGYIDAEGYQYISDRRTDLIISGGVNFYPQEVENTLASHPAVLDVAVIGVLNSELGETVKAVIQIKLPDTISELLAQEMISYCRVRLSKIKCPKSIQFEQALPRSETGKLLRRLLKERYPLHSN